MSEYYRDDTTTLLLGDTLKELRTLPDKTADCVVTSPPYYGLRDYGVASQYGMEASPAAYVETLRSVFSEVRRVIADDGTLWLNLGDRYAANSDGYRRGAEWSSRQPRERLRTGMPSKNLMGMPWRVALSMQDDGWLLRNAIIWHKPNALPESAQDRLATCYEYVFLFAKLPERKNFRRTYHFDLDAICEHVTGGRGASRRVHTTTNKPNTAAGKWDINKVDAKRRNPGDVWSIPTKPYPGAHFATFPLELPLRCIKAGCRPGGRVLDPFSGSGTTGVAAQQLGRRYIGIDLNSDYHALALRRLSRESRPTSRSPTPTPPAGCPPTRTSSARTSPARSR